MNEHTFGWIQNPADITKLRQTVELFDPSKPTHQEVLSTRLPNLITDASVRNRLTAAMSARPLRISYSNLTGSNRRTQEPNGIINAALKGQRRDYTDNWTADGFLRWAHSLGFITAHNDDTFSLSPLGQRYIDEPADAKGINAVLKEAFLAYPPVVRILHLLSEAPDYHLTKYEIGRHLGFSGEAGFTNFPQELLVRELALQSQHKSTVQPATDRPLFTETDSEGTSDKYARMIAGWLMKVGWVKKKKKLVKVSVAGENYEHTLSQAYTITGTGTEALKQARSIPRRVFYEMLATKSKSRNYLRLRRASMLKFLENGKPRTAQDIQTYLSSKNISASTSAIVDDLSGFKNMGLDIRLSDVSAEAFELKDKIQHLVIPGLATRQTTRDDVEKIKDEVRNKMKHISHDRLVLIDLSFDGNPDPERTGKPSQLFELETASLLLLCGFHVAPTIGGPNRPDCVAYTMGTPEDFGLIVDAKAYVNGFNCGRESRYEMLNYLRGLIDKPTNHRSFWWNDLPEGLRQSESCRFLFITSRLIGGFRNHFAELSDLSDSMKGAAITAANLLLYADALLDKQFSLERGRDHFACLDEVKDIDVLT